jgi:hypothetical protein
MRKNLSKLNVYALLRDAGFDLDSLGLPEDRNGTVFYGDKIVAFRGKDGFYSRDEVCRFISDNREG